MNIENKRYGFNIEVHKLHNIIAISNYFYFVNLGKKEIKSCFCSKVASKAGN